MMTTPRLMLTTIIATLAYLGLAILGWGGFAAFLSRPPLIAIAITLFVLSGVAVFSGGNLSPGVREDRANRSVIVAFTSGVYGAIRHPSYLGLLVNSLGWALAFRSRVGVLLTFLLIPLLLWSFPLKSHSADAGPQFSSTEFSRGPSCLHRLPAPPVM